VKSKHTKLIVVGIVTVLSAGIFIVTLRQSIVGSTPSETYTAAVSMPTTTPVSTLPEDLKPPSRLIIPSISVDAAVQEVGLTKNKEMGIPTNFTDVGWYKHGPIPGEAGNALIDGHVDNALALPGVFKYLADLKVGDEIYVLDKEKKETRFVVTSIDSYRYDEVPVADIFGDTDKRLLRLITCGGRWVRASKTYDTRIIVTAELTSFSMSSTLNMASP